MRRRKLAKALPGWVLVTCAVAACTGASARAQAPRNVAEQYLLQAANAERVARGLPRLRWDERLYEAASTHARQMAQRASIAHQYAGEPELAERAQTTGARFSVVAENVAEAPTAVLLQQGWMQSEHHRDNLLDPRLDRVAISVLRRDGQLYAVEDFERGVTALSFAQQEQAVAELLTATGTLQVGMSTEAARATCELDRGYAGPRRPWFVMRFTAAELNALPDELRSRLATGKYHEAQVGACPLRDAGHFAGYNLAVLLFP